LNQRRSEIKNLEKSIKINRDKMELLQQEYSAFSRALKETEQALTVINTVGFFFGSYYCLFSLKSFKKRKKYKSRII
jgi:hypothetical protein